VAVIEGVSGHEHRPGEGGRRGHGGQSAPSREVVHDGVVARSTGGISCSVSERFPGNLVVQAFHWGELPNDSQPRPCDRDDHGAVMGRGVARGSPRAGWSPARGAPPKAPSFPVRAMVTLSWSTWAGSTWGGSRWRLPRARGSWDGCLVAPGAVAVDNGAPSRRWRVGGAGAVVEMAGRWSGGAGAGRGRAGHRCRPGRGCSTGRVRSSWPMW
jgi:hypothetical protein